MAPGASSKELVRLNSTSSAYSLYCTGPDVLVKPEIDDEINT